MEILEINYVNESGGEGRMELYCDKFFPCAQRDAKIVFPLVVKFCTSETIQELKKHFVDEQEKCNQAWKENSKKYMQVNQTASDILQLIATGKHPSGVKATAEEIQTANFELAKVKAECRQAMDAVKRNRRLISKYDKNIELLEQYKAKAGV